MYGMLQISSTGCEGLDSHLNACIPAKPVNFKYHKHLTDTKIGRGNGGRRKCTHFNVST